MEQNSGSIFSLPEFKGYENKMIARRRTANTRRRYYEGTIYDDTGFRLAHKLYAQTKALFSFLARAVDLDVALVPGVMGPWDLADGTPRAIAAAQAQLYEWSEWATEGDAWLEDGATIGEAMIKIVPDPTVRTVQLQRLRPELCLLVRNHVDAETGQAGELALIVDPHAEDPTGARYEYAEAITPSQVRTYRNGAPAGMDGQPDRYDNPLGFVPVVRANNDTDRRPTFAKVLPQLDSVNELASYLHNIIGRHAEPQWAAFGAEQGDLVRGQNVWFFPNKDAKLEAILAEIDIAGALAFIGEIKGEMKSNLPELAFDDLRAKAQIATETLEVQLVELDAKIWKMRRRYDAALIQAHHMAAMAATMYGIPELSALLAPHSMDYKRPVRPISELEQIQLAQARIGLEMSQQLLSGDGMTQALAGQAGPGQRQEQTQDAQGANNAT